MKKRLLSLLLTLVMILGMIPATSLTAFAATTSVTGIEVTGDGYYFRSSTNSYHINDIDVSMISGTSKIDPDTYSTNSLYTDEACTTWLNTEPKLGETYYFDVYVIKADTTNNITNSNSNIKIGGFYEGKVLSTETTNNGFFYCVCSITYGELTGGVKAVASGVEYDSAKGGYAPNFTTLKAVSTEGKELEHIVLEGNYSYYEARFGCLYKTNETTSFSDMLTTEPQEGETYYSYFRLDSIDGNLNIEEELVDIQIPGYEVEYLASYERDMGFTSLVVYSVTKRVVRLYTMHLNGTGYKQVGDYYYVDIVDSVMPSLDINSKEYQVPVEVGPLYVPGDGNLLSKPVPGSYYNFTITLTPETHEQYIVSSNSYRYNLSLFDDISNISARVKDDGSYVMTFSAKYVGPNVYVGGVAMYDGDYLANDATTTQTTKPTGGYAYYKNGKLTLNNYSYEGKGYQYDSEYGYYAVIYSKNDLTLELIGNNTLTQTYSDSDMIYVDGANLTVGGDGKLTGTSEGYALYADKDITINGGTVEVSTYYASILSYGDVIINDGDITAESDIRAAIYSDYDVTVNGGNVTATGGNRAISCDSFTVAEGMNIQASTTADGELGEYVAENHDSYKKIVIKTPGVYVGGVAMYDGDYLAVGATATQTTKPSGGYAYYEDGTLTLNNYSYEGEGYLYNSYYGYYATVFAEQDLTLELIGNNTLNQTESYSFMIYVDGANLTVVGDGKLTGTSESYALCADEDLTINGGTVEVSAKSTCILSSCEVIINDGDITAESEERIGIWSAYDVTINGGNVTATGGIRAISCSLLTVEEGMKIQASTTVDGELGEYVAANYKTYKKIVITPPDVYVGGVGMYDGDYLAAGVLSTQTTKPSGGYAYYKDGTLTLNNYSYEGKGYQYHSGYADYAVIYSKIDLTLELIGNNTLTQTGSYSDMIYVDGANLTVGGDGKLTGTAGGFGLCADKDITINGGTVEVSTYLTSINSNGGEVIINDGDITAETEAGAGIYSEYDVTVNGGNVTAIGTSLAIFYGYYYNFTVAEGMKIQASTTVDGELGEYVAENHDSYKKIVITTTGVYVVGDINKDGTVNVIDVVLLKRSIASKEEASLDIEVADINGNGVINAIDVIQLKRNITGGYN